MLAALVSTSVMQAQTSELFQPYKANHLRLPSVPLVVNDPYFSIWSPYDRLTDGSTRHWDNAEKALDGLLRVDGSVYRFMGASQKVTLEAVVPMADVKAWTAPYTRTTPAAGWERPGYDDSSWKEGTAAFGSPGKSHVNTLWNETNSDLYVRRTVELKDEDLKSDLYLVYSHDDVMELYINGTKVVSTGETWLDGERLHLTGSQKKLLKAGKNILAAHCHNTTGGAYADFGIFKNTSPRYDNIKTAQQKAVSVMATSTYYTFACGPVELDVVFTAPMLIDDYDLLSTPINYISYQVRSTDKRPHRVQFYLSTTPQLAVNKEDQPTESSVVIQRGVKYLKAGTIEQPILAKKGDNICIDWGYLYLPNVNGDVCMDTDKAVMDAFLSTGELPDGKTKVVSRSFAEMPTLAYCHDFGSVDAASSFALIGYDEIQDIEYMFYRYKAYWAHDGKVTIFDAFDKLQRGYTSIMEKCRALDKRIYDDGLKASGEKYAEILAASYRHVIAAHKLFKDKDGNLLFFSKENNSNGCVNTVDLTYPSAPLFLIYNPELTKAMMTSILDYSLSGRWTKPFAAHDLGTYPIADGQVYGGDMPLEEAGNIIILTAMVSKLDGNTSYANKYWPVLTTWADYLAANGQDPANQLCTDDFAGHWAHNANLSLKAIMGVAGYAEMARVKGDKAVADKYMKTAKDMAEKWEETARDGDHYALAFDRKQTWSQKYNMVWDKLWQLNLFPKSVMKREIKYYLTKQNKYGLPLDCRKDYTKNDWIMWTAAMSPDNKTFEKFVDPVWRYINETPSRVPISDWYMTTTGEWVSFRARSVIGGFWMKVLADKLLEK